MTIFAKTPGITPRPVHKPDDHLRTVHGHLGGGIVAKNSPICPFLPLPLRSVAPDYHHGRRECRADDGSQQDELHAAEAGEFEGRFGLVGG
jgi:hypothetical protein